MHILQALKMACKSLWTNKMRSFLTMLGIIIGVLTVSLLTTVAQGVSNAVVSSIREQSTMAALMNMDTTIDSKMTYKNVNDIIRSVQPEDKNAEDYFDYSLAITSKSIVALENLEGVLDSDIKDYILSDKPYSFSEEQLNYWKEHDEEKYTYAKILMQLKARPKAIDATVYAVDKNFAEVYNLKFDGRFPENSSELLVDEDFVKAFLPNTDRNKIIGKEISLGISCTGTKISISFAEDTGLSGINLDEVSSVASSLLGLTVNSINLETDTITIETNQFVNVSNERVKTEYKTYFEGLSLNATEVSVEDIYSGENAKSYTIVGISKTEDNSLFSFSFEGDETDGPSISDIMSEAYPTQQSSCFMLYEEENLGVIEGSSGVDDSVITYAYFRYKTEDVMTKSINKISVAFASKGIIILRDFMMVSMSSVASIITQIMNILTVMLTVISVISLIVGGIGIMNIMLVAVTERTREIGIRKAIGAKKSSILVQFLIEALLLSLIGGAIGLIISAIGSAIIGSIMGITLLIPGWVVAMSLGFCTAIGLIFGMFPAIKASNMQPIDALRRE